MIDPARRLADALVALGGDRTRLVCTRSTPWASATFAGVLARVVLSLPSAAADRLAGVVADHEFAIPRHLVADIVIAAREEEAGGWATLSIEALVLEEA